MGGSDATKMAEPVIEENPWLWFDVVRTELASVSGPTRPRLDERETMPEYTTVARGDVMSDQQRFDQVEPASTKASLESVQRPLTIRLAVIGMWIGAGLAALNVAVAYFEKIASNRTLYEDYRDNEVLMDRLVHTDVWPAVGIAAAFAVVEIALWITMAMTNRHGFKWARMVATTLGVFGLLLAIGGIVTSIIYDTAIAVSIAHSVATQIASIAVLVLLWLPESSSYYRTRTHERSQLKVTGAASTL